MTIHMHVPEKTPTDLLRYAEQLLSQAAQAANIGAAKLSEHSRTTFGPGAKAMTELELVQHRDKLRTLQREIDYQEGVQHGLTAALGELLDVPHDKAADMVLERVMELEDVASEQAEAEGAGQLGGA
jgi:hypothetical protein